MGYFASRALIFLPSHKRLACFVMKALKGSRLKTAFSLLRRDGLFVIKEQTDYDEREMPNVYSLPSCVTEQDCVW